MPSNPGSHPNGSRRASQNQQLALDAVPIAVRGADLSCWVHLSHRWPDPPVARVTPPHHSHSRLPEAQVGVAQVALSQLLPEHEARHGGQRQPAQGSRAKRVGGCVFLLKGGVGGEDASLRRFRQHSRGRGSPLLCGGQGGELGRRLRAQPAAAPLGQCRSEEESVDRQQAPPAQVAACEPAARRAKGWVLLFCCSCGPELCAARGQHGCKGPRDAACAVVARSHLPPCCCAGRCKAVSMLGCTRWYGWGTCSTGP